MGRASSGALMPAQPRRIRGGVGLPGAEVEPPAGPGWYGCNHERCGAPCGGRCRANRLGCGPAVGAGRIYSARPNRSEGSGVVSKQQVLGSIRWSALETSGDKLLGLVLLLILARLVGPEAFGLVAVASAALALAAPLCTLGLSAALIQRRTLVPGHLDAAFWTILGASTTMALGFLFAADFVADVMQQPDLAPILRWLSPALLMQGLIVVQDAQFRRALDFRALALRTLTAKLFGGAVGVGCALAGMGAYSLVAQGLSQGIVSLVLIWSLSNWRPRARFELSRAAELLHFARSMLGVDMLRLYNQNTPRLFVGFFLGPAAAAYFALADRLFFAVIGVLTQSLQRVALPVFSRLQETPDRVAALFYRSTGTIAMASFPACAGLALIAPEAIGVLLGEAWQAAIPAVQLLILAGLSASLSFLNGSVLTALGHPELRLYFGLVRAAIGTSLFLFCHLWGIMGMVLAYLLRALLSEPLQLVYAARILPHFSWRAYLSALLRALAATALMVAAVVAVGPWLASVHVASALAAKLGLGAVVYMIASLILNGAALRDIMQLVKTRRS